MRTKTNTWHKLTFLFATLLFSAQALADCPDTCALELSKCEQATSQEQQSRCEEKFNICTLSCNRDKTMYCTYLGFKDHEGTADKEKELEEVTGGFARVTSDGRPHFGGLCSSNNMKCDHVLAWDKSKFFCGGEVREPRRVACCR